MFPKRRKSHNNRTYFFLKLRRIARGWATQFFLGLITTFFCTLATPIFAKVPAVAPVVQNQPNQSQRLQQGKTFYEEGKFADAAAAWQQAAKVYQEQGDRINQALALNYLCLAYQQLGQWNEAESAIRKAIATLNASSLKLLQEQPTTIPSTQRLPVLAQALNMQGQLQLAQGQAEPALNTWKQATTIYAQIGDRTGMTGSLINQAQALQNLGLYRLANKTLTEVKQALQNQPDTPIKITALRSLGNALRVVGKLDESRQILQQSLALAEQLQSSSDISAILLSLGNTARTQQDTEAALEFYQQATESSTSPLSRAQAQLNQLSLLLDTKQVSNAQALASQIQAEISNLPSNRAAVYAQINFAQSLTRLGQMSTTSTFSSREIGQILAKALQQAKTLNDARTQAYALGQLGAVYEQTQQFQNAQDLTEQALLIAQTNNAPDIAYR
ncbi:tetratricopeptide repeat protein, partial [Allocoleopsis sp.]|uniref:tetratricopeptide repeat protein n=1 Tax=Allocoleopsis sp. TaxID=3088169 RepID=UPI002FD50F14